MYRTEHQENTRLFILTGKGVKEETFREKFEQYGKIDDLWIVKDKRTNEDKGNLCAAFVCYGDEVKSYSSKTTYHAFLSI